MTALISDRYMVVKSKQPETYGKYIVWDKYSWEFCQDPSSVKEMSFDDNSAANEFCAYQNLKQTAHNNILVEFSRLYHGGAVYDIEFEDIHNDMGRVKVHNVTDIVAATYFLVGVMSSWGINYHEAHVMADKMISRAIKDSLELNREEIRNGRDDL